MKAYQLTAYGSDTLTLAEVDEPTLSADGVRVRVHHIAVNPLDWKIRNGDMAEMLDLRLPTVIGTDLAGMVLEVGADVTDLAVGDQVVGYADSGAFADVVTTRRPRVTRVPDGLDPATAVALLTGLNTAHRAFGVLDAPAGSTVVVHGAAGAVGSVVTQLLARDHTVIGTGSPDNQDRIRALGATPVGYGAGMVDELNAAAPQGIDAAIDAAGHDFVARVAPLLPANRIVTLVDFAAASAGAKVPPGHPLEVTPEGSEATLEEAARGRLTIEIDSTFAFDRLPDALDRSEHGHPHGKVLVSVR